MKNSLKASLNPSTQSLDCKLSVHRPAEAFKQINSIGEESYSAGTRPALTDAPTFCVDPIGMSATSLFRYTPTLQWIDGTTNFIHGLPFCCVSIGLIYQRRPVLGVVYNPFLEHLVCPSVASRSTHNETNASISESKAEAHTWCAAAPLPCL